MASKRRPRLSPVAAPTDPYVTPGAPIPGEALGGFNFQALGQLSETVHQFLQTEDARIRREKSEARQEAHDAREANEQAVQTLTKEQWVPFRKALSDENYEALRNLGITEEDHPVTLQAINNAYATRELYELDYLNKLTEPGALNAAKAEFARAGGDSDVVEAHIAPIREALLEELGPLGKGSELALEAQMSTMEKAVAAEFAKDREAHFKDQQKALHAQQLQHGLQAYKDSVDTPTPFGRTVALGSSIASIGVYMETRRKAGVKMTVARSEVLDQLEEMARDAEDADEAEAISGFMDFLEEGLDWATEERRFNDVDGILEAVKRRDDTDTKIKLPEVEKQTRGHLLRSWREGRASFYGTRKEAEAYFLTGEGREVVLEVARREGIHPDLLSDTVYSVIDKVTRRPSAVSKPGLTAEILRDMERNPEAGLEKVINNLEDLSSEDTRFLLSRGEALSKEPALKPEIQKLFDADFEAWAGAFGTLDPEDAQHGARLLAKYRAETRKVYNETEDIEQALDAGRAVISATPEAKRMVEAQQENQFSNWRQRQDVAAVFLDHKTSLSRIGAEEKARQQDEFDVRKWENYERGILNEMENLAERMFIKAQANNPNMSARKLARQVAEEFRREAAYEMRKRAELVDVKQEAVTDRDAQRLTEDRVGDYTRNPQFLTPADSKRITPVGTDKWSNTYDNLRAAYSRNVRHLIDHAAADDGVMHSKEIKARTAKAAKLELALLLRLTGEKFTKRPDGAVGSVAGNLVDNIKPGEELVMLQGILKARGLNPEELAVGKIHGIYPIKDVFGPNYQMLLNPKIMAIYSGEAGIEQAQKDLESDNPNDTLTGKAMKFYHLSAEDPAAVKLWMDAARDNLRRRGFGPREGIPKATRTKYFWPEKEWKAAAALENTIRSFYGEK